MTIQYKFKILGAFAAEQVVEGILGKVLWDCELREDTTTLHASGETFLRRSAAPADVMLGAATDEQLIEWLIASEGGQTFLDSFIEGHAQFMQYRKIDALMTVPIARGSHKVPLSVSRFQARAALLQAGLLETVEAYMADPATDRFVRIAWEDAQEFLRNSPTVQSLQPLLDLTDEQLDDLFRFAATISA